jgi:hypothetical protein
VHPRPGRRSNQPGHPPRTSCNRHDLPDERSRYGTTKTRFAPGRNRGRSDDIRPRMASLRVKSVAFPPVDGASVPAVAKQSAFETVAGQSPADALSQVRWSKGDLAQAGERLSFSAVTAPERSAMR